MVGGAAGYRYRVAHRTCVRRLLTATKGREASGAIIRTRARSAAGNLARNSLMVVSKVLLEARAAAGEKRGPGRRSGEGSAERSRVHSAQIDAEVRLCQLSAATQTPQEVCSRSMRLVVSGKGLTAESWGEWRR